jgi:hypothetical protein
MLSMTPSMFSSTSVIQNLSTRKPISPSQLVSPRVIDELIAVMVDIDFDR